MPPKFTPKLKEYEEKVIKSTHRVILHDQGVGDLLQKKEGMAARIARISSPQLSRKATRRFKKAHRMKTSMREGKMKKQDLLTQYSSLVQHPRKNDNNDLGMNLVPCNPYDREANETKKSNSPSRETKGSKERSSSNEVSHERYDSDSSNSEEFQNLSEKVSALTEKVRTIENKLYLIPNFEPEDAKTKFEEIQKWQKRMEEYVSQLHSDIEEIQNLNKQFKLDLYEKFRSQRKITGELDKKVTGLYSQKHNKSIFSSYGKRMKEIRLQSIG